MIGYMTSFSNTLWTLTLCTSITLFFQLPQWVSFQNKFHVIYIIFHVIYIDAHFCYLCNLGSPYDKNIQYCFSEYELFT